MKEALEKYKHSSQSKHCTKEELLKLIQSISEDIEKETWRETLNALQERLEFLKSFIAFAELRGVDQDKLQDLFAHTEALAIHAAYWLAYVYINWGDEMPSIHLDVPEEICFRVLKASRLSCSSHIHKSMDDKIVVHFIDSLLGSNWELIVSSSSFTVYAMKILIEELTFLRYFLVYHREEFGNVDQGITNLIGAVANEAGIIICCLSSNEMDTELQLSNFMEKVELIKADIAEKYPETWRCRFSRTNELGFLDALLENLKELTGYKPDSIGFAKGQIDVVLEDLVVLRDFLRNTEQHHEDEVLKALRLRVVEVAYKIELIINSLVVGDHSPACTPNSFNTVKEEIKKINSEVKEIYVEKRYQIEDSNNVNTSNHLQSTSSYPMMDEVMVGFEDEFKKLIDRLQARTTRLDIVSIAGMPGLGKTTLAKKVYNDNSIKSHFHVLAWCCVSQEYQKRKLLIDILSHTGGFTYGTDKTIEDLEHILFKSLKGRRYLIVLDDVWNIEAWRDLQLCFPDDCNGSRIVVTSRIHNVTLRDNNPYSLRPLTDDESWELLQKKLFHNNDFPPKLHDVGKLIAKNCKGLPLAVVIIAGILATLPQGSWKDLAGKSANVVSDRDECKELLELSYKHLPDYLKPCLLYFGSFLEDEEVPVPKLLRLWMAEGFVQKTTEKSLEKVAEDYLKDLIGRSLVKVAKQRSTGEIKACSMHDLVHQFSATKARKDNFLYLVNDGKKLGPIIEPRRLCIYSTKRQFWKTRLLFLSLCSLRFIEPHSRYESKSDASFLFHRFKLLKILDLESFPLYGSFPGEVEMLVHLRYFGSSGAFTSIPPTIDKLWNLETFVVKSWDEVSLPYTLFNMTKLRHVHVSPSFHFSLPKENLEKSEKLCKLMDTFSTPFISSMQDLMELVRKVPNVRTLSCVWDANEGCQLQSLNSLDQLESLKLISTGRAKYMLEFSFPTNLKKLTLSAFCLPWTEVSRFSKLLPNLEVLKVVDSACEGETWYMEEEEFPKLQFLKLTDLDIVHWDACSDNFPCLRKLVLNSCTKLKGIPLGLAEICTLEMIEVKWCNLSTASSAEEILQEREELKVSID